MRRRARQTRTGGSVRAAQAVLGLVVAVAVWPGGPVAARVQPRAPARLVVEAPLLAKLQLLAAGLRTEVALCLHGATRGDTARAREFSMPEPRISTAAGSTFQPCPPGTLAVWHNHPWPVADATPPTVTLGPTGAPAHPSDLCALSARDIETAVRLGHPFVVVAVDADTWCWWTRDQVAQLAADRAALGPPVADQTFWRAGGASR